MKSKKLDPSEMGKKSWKVRLKKYGKGYMKELALRKWSKKKISD